MKKSLYLLLILMMVLSLGMLAVGCGDEEETATTAAPATTATTAAPTETTAAPATETTAAPTETTAAPVEAIKLKTASGMPENSANAEIIKYFCDYVTEKTGGAIEFEAFYGGSLATDPEVPEYVKKGELDLSIVQCVYTMQSFPLGFSLAGYDSMQGTMDKCFELLADPEIGPMIQAQAEANNWHIIGYTAAGRSLLLSKTEVKSWADAAAQKLTIGSPINQDVYQALGLSTVAVEPPDMYEALSRGVCDLVAFGGPSIYTAKLWEVAKHIGDMRSFFANQDIMFNLDVWNSFTDEQKAIMEEAAKAACDWSVTRSQETEDLLKVEIEKAGGTWNTFTDEEGKNINAMFMKGVIGMLSGFADNLGTRAEQDKLTAAWGRVLNQTF